MIDQPKGLISVLLDKTARTDERDDAAMDLANYPSNETRKALFQVASDPLEESIADVAGESLGHVWVEMDMFDSMEYKKLIPNAQREAFYVIRSRKPEWIEKYNLSA